MDTVKINKGNARIIAHRGLSGLERENTASAFVAAGNRSYYGIETDVRPTADGKFVLLHDDDTSRCGIDSVVPERSTLDEIQSVRLLDMDGKKGRFDLRVPELRDYLSICKRYEKIAVLEFKGAFDESQMAALVGIVKAEYSLDSMIFISFHFQNLVLLRRFCPNANCQFLTGELNDEIIKILKDHKMGIDIWQGALDEEAKVKKLIDNGIAVNVWTVDSKETAERLISWGVSYITSNILE